MLSAIVTTAVMYLLIVWAYAALHKTPVFQAAVSPSASKKEKRDAYLRLHLQAAGVAIAAGLLVYLTGNVENPTWVLALPCYGFAVAGFVGLFLWGRYADELREVIPFTLLALMMVPTTGGAAATLGSLINVPVVGPIIMISNGLAGTAFLGYMLSTALFSSAKKSGKSSHKVLGIIVMAIFIISLIAQLVFGVAIGSFVNSVRADDMDMDGLTTSMSAQGTTGSTDNTGNWFSQFIAAIFGGNKANQPEQPTEATSSEPEQSAEDQPADQNQPAEEQPDTSEVLSTWNGMGTPIAEDLKAKWAFRHDAVIADNYDASGVKLTGDALEKAKKNDYDFGYSVLDEAIAMGLTSGRFKTEDLAGKTEDQLYRMVGVVDVLELFVDAINYDPALGAADMGWHAALMHTNEFLGDFYSQWKEKPDAYMRAINSAKDGWVKDRDAYWAEVRHFINVIQAADKISIEYRTDITDHMYQFGAKTLEENKTIIPGVSVMESADHKGYFLTFTYNVMETRVVKVSYDISRGFVPANVAEVVHVTPAKNPNKPSSGGGSSAGGGSTGTGAGGAANNDGKAAGGAANSDGKAAGGAANPDTTKRQDDPLTATWSPKTLDRGYQEYHVSDGPDEYTGSTVGAQNSTKEVNLTGSTFMDSYEEYKEYAKENLVEPNNGGTRTAKDPNTPTYTPSKEMPADNNADKGNGGAPIDNLTPGSPGITYTVPADGGVNTGTTDGNKPAGTTVRVTNEPRGTDWGGLPDA